MVSPLFVSQKLKRLSEVKESQTHIIHLIDLRRKDTSMRMEIVGGGSGNPLTVKMLHKGQSSLWNIAAYARTSAHSRTIDFSEDGIETNNLFDEINEYWAQLPPERTQAIWDTYVQIHALFENNFELVSINTKLKRLVKQLFEYMPLTEIRHWMIFHSRVRIPSTLKEQYGPHDPQDRTYLLNDYRELAVLAIALRTMVPVWGEYISRAKPEIGSIFVSLMALGLLHDCALIQSEPMERLRVYVESSVQHAQDQGPSATAVLSFIGSVELPVWVLSMTVVRRLSVGEISAPDDTSHIITNVYQFITNTLKSIDRKFGGKFGGRVNEKTQPAGQGEEANASVVEMYKVKQTVSDGDLVTANVYTEQTLEMAMKVESSIDPTMLDACLHYIQVLANQPIQPHHVALTQWIMAPCLSPPSIPQLNKPSLLRAMAVTQTVLWHWGFFDIAALATATPLMTGKDEMSSSLESRGRIPKELMEELQTLYPHYQQKRGKQQSVRQLNPAAVAIDTLCASLTRSDWHLNAPEQLLTQTSRIENTKKLIVPADIRAHLARLIIKIRLLRG